MSAEPNADAKKKRGPGRPRIMHGRSHPDADRLNKIMEQHGLNESDLARQLGRSRRIVRYWRNGTIRVPHVVWMALSFMTGAKPPRTPPLVKTDAEADAAARV